MKIIYHCYGGSHSSVLAAALHLKLVDSSTMPSFDDLFRLPFFDKTCDADFGSIRKMGEDEWGHEIFVLGKKDLGARYSKILQGVAALVGVEDELLAVDVIGKVNWLMKVGGYTSRKLGLVSLGRFFLYQGTKNSFPKIVSLVDSVKNHLGSDRKNYEDIIYRY